MPVAQFYRLRQDGPVATKGREMKKLIAGALFTLFLPGCAASGVQVKEEQLSQFEVGRTTVRDVVASLGNPSAQMRMPDGSICLIYSYAQINTRPETFIPFVGAFVGGTDMKTNSATLNFDKSGILKTTSSSSGVTGTGVGLSSGAVTPDRVPDQPRQAP